jgi:hypothetical protein
LMIAILTGVRWNLYIGFDFHFFYGQGCWAFYAVILWLHLIILNSEWLSKMKKIFFVFYFVLFWWYLDLN